MWMGVGGCDGGEIHTRGEIRPSLHSRTYRTAIDGWVRSCVLIILQQIKAKGYPALCPAFKAGRGRIR